jgi:hypothetical protein
MMLLAFVSVPLGLKAYVLATQIRANTEAHMNPDNKR